jgi:hypothetical protein
MNREPLEPRESKGWQGRPPHQKIFTQLVSGPNSQTPGPLAYFVYFAVSTAEFRIKFGPQPSRFENRAGAAAILGSFPIRSPVHILRGLDYEAGLNRPRASEAGLPEFALRQLNETKFHLNLHRKFHLTSNKWALTRNERALNGRSKKQLEPL